VARSADALDARDHQILLAVLRNPEHSQEAIGSALALSARTINRRVNKPAFQARLKEEYARSIENAVLIARANAPKAVRTHISIMNNANAEDRDRIAAAREVTRLAIESKINVAFDERGLNVNHRLDLSLLDDDELQVLEKLLAKMGALAKAAVPATTDAAQGAAK
jgi:DNA-binding Lrp family transcriptional regulator